MHCHHPQHSLARMACPWCDNAQNSLPLAVGHILQPGLLQTGRYQIEALLSHTPHALTYRARHLQEQKTVLIKEYAPSQWGERDLASGNFRVKSAVRSLFEACLRRFIKQARTIGAIRHSTLMPIQDVFAAHQTAYMVLEPVEGLRLDAYLAARGGGGLPLPEVEEITAHLVAALSHLHRHFLSHLYVQPAHVIRSRDRYILWCFPEYCPGAGKQRELISDYSAPEVKGSGSVGPWSDLFSLGLILCELLTGQKPDPAYPLEGLERPEWTNWRIFLAALLRRLPSSRPYQLETHWNQFCSPAQRVNPAPRRLESRTLSTQKIANRHFQLDIEMVWIPPGRFIMGSPAHEAERNPEETAHLVVLTQGFYLQTTPVTQNQWEAVMKDNPSCFQAPDHPVDTVSWNDCQSFILLLNKLSGKRFRLPSEAEWEYACRAGTETAFALGNGHDLDSTQANFNGQFPAGQARAWQDRRQSTPVKSFLPNAWGLYDMHGNVWEWCQDWKAPYPSEPVCDPLGPEHGVLKVGRGGSWYFIGSSCRSAFRDGGPPEFKLNYLGLRLALDIAPV